MLGENIPSVSWPDCGKIDIMELVGGGAYNDRTIYGTVHFGVIMEAMLLTETTVL